LKGNWSCSSSDEKRNEPVSFFSFFFIRIKCLFLLLSILIRSGICSVSLPNQVRNSSSSYIFSVPMSPLSSFLFYLTHSFSITHTRDTHSRNERSRKKALCALHSLTLKKKRRRVLDNKKKKNSSRR
jgi:hypothetical protein